MQGKTSKLLRATSIVALVAVPMTTAASAQDTTARSADFEEIVVTSRKRSETLQDVPFSVNAKTEEQLRNSGATGLADMARNVAGLAITDLGPGQSQIAIRGVAAGQTIRDMAGVKEQVGVYLDESPISVALFTPDVDLFDLERVEVLRGPQGTLFGAGSLSGTVRYITKAPEMNSSEAVVEAGANQVDGGGFGWSLKTAVNLPIAEDKAAIRAVAYHTKMPGFIDAVTINGREKDVNDGGKSGFRVAATFKPTENLSITPRILFQKLDTDGYPRIDVWNILGNPYTTTEPAVTLGEREQYVQLEEGLSDNFMLLDGKVEYEGDNVIFTSITSYTDREVEVVRDATQLTGSVTFDFGAPDGVRLDAPLTDTTDLKIWSQEVRLSSNNDGPLTWVLGGYYTDWKRDYGQVLDTPGWTDATGVPTQGTIGAGVDQPYWSALNIDFKQVALFGEATYAVSDRMDITGGLRWYDYDEERRLRFDGPFADPTDRTDNAGANGFAPRVILSYDTSDDVTVNAQVSKGFRLGGVNDPINLPLCSDEDKAIFGGRDQFEDESVWNYEVGAKANLGNKGSLNVAGFYTDINGLQIPVTAGSCSSRLVMNVPSARSMGVEAEFTYRPTENMDFAMGATITDAEIRSTVVDGAGNVIGAIEKGNRLPTAPKFQFNAALNYYWQFGTDYEGFISATFQHVGSVYSLVEAQADGYDTFTPRNYGGLTVSSISFDPKLPSYNIGNFRIGARRGHYEIAFFVNNLWDERAYLSLDVERGRVARVGYLTNQPRTFGVNFRSEF
ncbi:TonB-dependent receptor [Gimibacter soli]|uniref:TonB-dependent receptor n=1 Tax=Gimibacter soli TaxID=3024400 RepID=A0AAF0BLV9_9PROT|nr:TonB-dependent receptor [Gimibacter soli]WCL53611.1 TonB-dependent receptor [Gimibacter soli]